MEGEAIAELIDNSSEIVVTLMKKGQEYIGIVEEIKFPNKGIVRVIQDSVEEIPTRAESAQEEKAISENDTMHESEGTEKCTVKNVIPGQKIKFRVTKKRGGNCEGQMLEVIEKAKDEIESPCPHFNVCGGCVYQNLPYDKQLEIKDKQIRDLLMPVIKRGFSDLAYRGKIENTPSEVDIMSLFEKIKGSPVQFDYRNKMELSFGDACKDGPLELGLHKSGSFYDIVTVKECCIMDEDYRKIIKETLAYFRGKETKYYHKNSHEGYLRHLLIRKAAKTEEILIDLVTTSEKPVDTPCTENGLLEDWREALLGLKLKGKIVGILNTINDSLADAVKNEGTTILYGKDWFIDEVLGLKFKITPFSFFQTNTLSAEVLYDTVREFVNSVNTGGSKDKDDLEKVDLGKDDVGLHKVMFDLYSGTGTITQLMSTVADEVYGVEIVEEAVEAAKENAELNGLHNCKFIAGDVLKVLDDISKKPDFIILDPPRDGINPKALGKIIDYGVDNIVYVSCKPSSLARDLEIFMAHGYVPVRVAPIDQFPGTAHVETVCLLSKKAPV